LKDIPSGISIACPKATEAEILQLCVSHIGRAEVFQPIPPPGARSPDRPHTHVLPKLLARGRTHAATEPLPEGWIPSAHLYPAHPLRDQFGRKHAFQA
jgi:hypothetical protein